MSMQVITMRRTIPLLVVLSVTSWLFLSVASGFSPAFLVPLRLSQPRAPVPTRLWGESTAEPANSNNNDEEDEENDGNSNNYDASKRPKKKRDRLKDWMTSSSQGPMVQPIRMEDGSVVEQPPPASVPEDQKQQQQQAPRIRAKFDNLFGGMPSLLEIVSGDDDDDNENSDDNDSTNKKKNKNKKQPVDDSWFDAERDQIQQNYQQILQDMLAQLQEERRQDPQAVIPENAAALIQSVLKQEMDAELKATKERRAQEKLQQYEQELMAAAASAASADQQEHATPNPLVEKLMQDSAAEYAQQEASRAELEAFLRYEQEAFQKAAQRDKKSNSNNNNEDDDDMAAARRPRKGEDLDRWALDRMEDMAQEQMDVDGGESVLDNLEGNVDDLRDRIQKEGIKSRAARPDDLKEWQMYRSIATSFTKGVQGDEAKYEGEIKEQLESWKSYLEKEKGIRKESGLTRGPKLPFDWHEFELEEAQQSKQKDMPDKYKKMKKIEARKEVNRMSIEALESLLEKSDEHRREKLQKEIEYLKATLESKDYLDIDESLLLEEDMPTGPVDMSNVFQTSSSVKQEEEKSPSSQNEPFSPSTPPMDDSEVSEPPATPFVGGTEDVSREENVTPPNTPFFSDPEDPAEKAPAPNTPFFSESTTTEQADTADPLGSSKLGSMEEQKLEAMFRRAGARTTEERNVIRAQWEDFQNVEKQKREMSGLSGTDDSEDEAILAQKELKYNVSEVMKGDGDFDAEKILATIGPRPVRKKKSKTSTGSSVPVTEGTEGQQEIDPSMESSVDDDEVMDSLYRSVSAVGGGRYKNDPEGDSKQKASFEEFMRKEKELRDSLDVLGEDMEPAAAIENDVEYAEEVLSSLGPRPQPKRTRIIDEGDYSDKGGVLAESDDEDEEESDDSEDSEDQEDDTTESSAFEESDDSPAMPEWLRRENEEAKAGKKTRTSFLGSEIDEVFDDTDYDKNMRQLAEYERRRAGKERQMGIDISDVIGRSAFESDDYADYKFDSDYQRERQDSWGSQSFENRKANLLDYTELELLEVNALMDHKDSVHATGVSQYLPRINKPFKEFGAIFRLEGILVDITGLQMKAWAKVAEEYGFRLPTVDEVSRASVTRPDIAIKDCLFWTDDFLECRKIATSHRKAFREVFEEWVQETGIKAVEKELVDPFPTKGGLAIGQEIVEQPPQRQTPLSEDESIRLATIGWTKTAEKYVKKLPNRQEILNAGLLSPEIAVLEVLRWSTDRREADAMANDYRQFFRKAQGSESFQSPQTSSTPDPSGPTAKPLSQNEVMELHYQAWLKVAARFGYENPTADEVVAAFVINDPLIAIRDGFAWTSDPTTLAEAVKTFQEALEEVGITAPSPGVENLAPPPVLNSGPALAGQDELFQKSMEAWTAVAQKSGLSLPDVDQVQFAFTVGPEEAVVTGFQWTDDAAVVEELVHSYRSELARRRGESAPERRPASLSKSTAPEAAAAAARTSGPTQDEVYQAAMDAWTATATKNGFDAPDSEQIQFALSVGPDEAVVTGFQWAEKPDQVAQLVATYMEELSQRRAQWFGGTGQAAATAPQKDKVMESVRVMPGVSTWIKSLLDVEMQCGVISHLDRDQVDILVEYAGLSHLLGKDKRVSASNGYNRESQQMLGAALRLERRPDHCVVFDTTPQASAAAHDVEMQSVNLIGPFPRYELLSADTTTSSFDELTAINIRRLFGERVYDQPMLDIQQTEPENRRRTKTKYFWDDD